MMKYYEEIRDIPRAAIIDLYDSVGWSTYTDKPDELMQAIANSTYIVACFDGAVLVGLARSISDDSAIHYLQDILVNPACHQRGIGRELFSRCLRRFEHVRSHVLLTDDEERQSLFYQSLGFRNTKTLKKVALNCYVKMNGMTLE